MPYLCEIDGLILAIKYSDGLGIRCKLVVSESPTTDAQIVISLFFNLLEVFFSGYACIQTDENLLLRVVRHTRFGV